MSASENTFHYEMNGHITLNIGLYFLKNTASNQGKFLLNSLVHNYLSYYFYFIFETSFPFKKICQLSNAFPLYPKLVRKKPLISILIAVKLYSK